MKVSLPWGLAGLEGPRVACRRRRFFLGPFGGRGDELDWRLDTVEGLHGTHGLFARTIPVSGSDWSLPELRGPHCGSQLLGACGPLDRPPLERTELEPGRSFVRFGWLFLVSQPVSAQHLGPFVS